MKKKILFYLIPLVSTSLFIILQLFNPPVIQEKVEGRLYDLRLNVRDNIVKQQPHQNILIVYVDEKSIREIGRWPWSRKVMAELVNKVSEGKPKVIGVDIMFSEKEDRESDERLAQAIKKAGNVVLATAFILSEKHEEVGSPQEVPDFLWYSAFMNVPPVPKVDEKTPWKNFKVRPEKVIPPLEEFSKVATLGHVYTHSDMDGILRREVMYLFFADDYYPSFSLQIARIARGIEMEDVVLYEDSGIMLGDNFIKTDLNGRVLINYAGEAYDFPSVSASDVIKGVTEPIKFKDKIVLIGTSALATFDQKATPLSGNMPGVEKNANVVENILLNNFIKKSPGFLEIIFILSTGIFLGVMLPRLRAVPGATIATGLMVFYVALSFFLLIYKNIWINLTYPLSNMLIIFVSLTVTKFFFEEKKAKEIRSMFSSYVSPKIVEVLINNPEKAKLGGERKVVTTLFSDIAGFTSLSEKRNPEEVVELLNEYFKEMTGIIFRWDGTLDKFIGDEIMAFWGAPVDQTDHAERAVRCAMEMIDSLSMMQEKWMKEGRDILDCGIGINTGEVLIGNIGALGKKMDYTIIGDHVNLAARVETLTRKYGSKIILTEFTLSHLETVMKQGTIDHYIIRELETVRVKGKEKEVKIFELRRSENEKP